MIKKILIVLMLLNSTILYADNQMLTAIKSIQSTKSGGNVEKEKTQAVSHYAIVLFFRSTCPHCQRFVPILKQVAQEKHLTVYAYSTDGGALPSYPTPLLATPSVLRTFFNGVPEVVPTVFLINTKNMAFTLVSQGEESANQLSDSLDSLLKGKVNEQA